MRKFKTSAVALMLVAMFSVIIPLTASADTISDLQAQIQALAAQLQTLRQQLRSDVASSTSTWASSTMPIWNGSSTPSIAGCLQINRTLMQGSRGDDVSQLQQQLAQDPAVYPGGAITGYFGSSTAAAVVRFQEKYGVSSSTAPAVGPRMRAFFRERCMSLGGMMGGNASGTMPMMPYGFGSTTMPFSSSTMPYPPREGYMRMWNASSSTSTMPMMPFGKMRDEMFNMMNGSGMPPMPPMNGGQGGFPPPSATSTQN